MPDGPRPNGPKYDDDFYAWSQYQTKVLRIMRTRNHRFDRGTLIEEIESLGRGERDAVHSQVRRILVHFLKLARSPTRDPRFDWMDSIADARAELADKLSPSLMRDIERRLPHFYAEARKRAELQPQRYGEYQAAQSLPEECPYTIDQIVAEDWYPDCDDGPNGNTGSGDNA
jgi:hypothetical protein